VGKPLVYIGIFLDEASRENLLKEFPPAFSNIYADHLTVQFRPDPETVEKYKDMYGSRFTLRVTGYVEDDKGQAVVVDPHGMTRGNSIPHITISTNNGVPPSYSNTLLRAGYSKAPHLILHGVLDTFPRGTWREPRVADEGDRAWSERIAQIWGVMWDDALSSKLRAVYELEYKYSSLKNRSFSGVEKRKETILSKLKSKLESACKATIADLADLFEVWIDGHGERFMEGLGGDFSEFEDEYRGIWSGVNKAYQSLRRATTTESMIFAIHYALNTVHSSGTMAEAAEWYFDEPGLVAEFNRLSAGEDVGKWEAELAEIGAQKAAATTRGGDSQTVETLQKELQLTNENLKCEMLVPLDKGNTVNDNCVGIERVISMNPRSVALQVGGSATFPVEEKILDNDAMQLFLSEASRILDSSPYDWDNWVVSFSTKINVPVRSQAMPDLANACINSAKTTIAPFKDEVAKSSTELNQLVSKYVDPNNPAVINKKLDRFSTYLTDQAVSAGKSWYLEAHDFAKDLSTKHNFSIEQTSAVTAILSPGISWDRNKKGAEKMITAYPNVVKVAGYTFNARKAYKVLAGEDIGPLISPKTSPKVFAFYNSILTGGESDFITLDFHMYNLWQDRYLPVSQRTSIPSRIWKAMYDTVLTLAKQYDMSGAEMQAALWVGWQAHMQNKA
jgi:hypothetical protein